MSLMSSGESDLWHFDLIMVWWSYICYRQCVCQIWIFYVISLLSNKPQCHIQTNSNMLMLWPWPWPLTFTHHLCHSMCFYQLWSSCSRLSGYSSAFWACSNICIILYCAVTNITYHTFHTKRVRCSRKPFVRHQKLLATIATECRTWRPQIE